MLQKIYLYLELIKAVNRKLQAERIIKEAATCGAEEPRLRSSAEPCNKRHG